MKSIKMFGKSIPLLAIVIVSMLGVGVYAGLVSYLSASVSMDAIVTSPVELRLYDGTGTRFESTFDLDGGESVDFSKIAYNKGENAVPFAIALVIKGEDVGDAVIVDSAGPIGGKKQIIGAALWDQTTPDIWNRDDLWCQVDEEAYYLHGAHDSVKLADYHFYGKLSTGTAFANPLNDKYVDALALSIGTDKYYVVIFGGTIGAADVEAKTKNDLVTNWGWGTPSSYGSNDNTPCIMGAESYDVGKVRVILDSAYVGTVQIGMQVVVPGTSIAQVISTMNLP